MGENKSRKLNSDSEGRIRVALGDVTNQLGNRGAPLVSRSPTSKSLSGSKRPAENSDDDSHFWKQVSLVAERLERESCRKAKCPKIEPNEVRMSPLKGGKTYRLQPGSSDVGSVGGNDGMAARDAVVEVKEAFVSTLDSIDLGENQHLGNVIIGDVVVKEGGFLSECCEKNCLEVGKECQGDETRGLSYEGENDSSLAELATQVVSDSGKSVGGEYMTSSRSESPETSRFTESQDIRSFGLERCTLLKGDGSNSLAADMDLLKNCSCSFCTKAGYIWSDLQCQDLKGRISTLTKSQKEANILARQYSVETAFGVAQGNPSTSLNLETNLTALWKSLFHQMGNNFAAESSQLQTNLAALNDIKGEYKMNLEMMNVMPPDMQQCSSDASESCDKLGS
ncbi:uncharacterized protein LOC141586885 [Silene latifolia]|uniref:uncharacterized protein LOC141586885 n=1 Tax=Silene latifolia TaxID=37657 RepID=UPI003D76D56C